MSKRHYPWWNYVKYIVQKYPKIDKALSDEEWSCTDLKDWSAVRSAIDCTERMENSLPRLKVIRMVHWDRTHTLEGAALSIPCDRSTAARWQKRFFEEVARNRGLMD